MSELKKIRYPGCMKEFNAPLPTSWVPPVAMWTAWAIMALGAFTTLAVLVRGWP